MSVLVKQLSIKWGLIVLHPQNPFIAVRDLCISNLPLFCNQGKGHFALEIVFMMTSKKQRV